MRACKMVGMEERERKSRGGLFIGCGVFLLIPVLYVLSVGPAHKLFVWYPAAIQYLGPIYRPLGWVADAFPPLKDALQWYLGFWR